MAMIANSSFDSEKKAWNVKLKGEVDIYTSNEFKENLQQISSEGEIYDIHMDFSELDYIDSTGLGILIGVLKRLKQNDKDVYIINPKNNIKKLFSITGLDKIFKMEGSI